MVSPLLCFSLLRFHQRSRLHEGVNLALAFKRGVFAILAGCLFSFASVTTAVARPPEPPAHIAVDKASVESRLSLRGTSDTVEVPIRVLVTGDVESLALTATLSRLDEEPLPGIGTTVFDTNLSYNKERDIEVAIPITFRGPGHYKLDITLQGHVGQGNDFSHRRVLHILLEKDGSFRLITGKELIEEKKLARQKTFEQQLKTDQQSPDIRLLFEQTVSVPEQLAEPMTTQKTPPAEQLRAEPADVPEIIKKYTIDNRGMSLVKSASGNITVKGRLVFQDYLGNWQPLINVTVSLYDDDNGPDEYLGSTVTDWSGNWSFTVDNNDGWFQDGRDVYYTFELTNTKIRVQDCNPTPDQTYTGVSSIKEDRSDGDVVDYGNETVSAYNGAMRVWSYLNLAWNHMATVGARPSVHFVDSCFPEENTQWDPSWEELDVEEAYDDGPDVVTHEYAHAIMHYPTFRTSLM